MSVLSTVRAEIADIQHSQREIQNLPLSRATIEAGLQSAIAELARDGRKRIAHLISTRQFGEILHPSPQSAAAVNLALFADEIAARIQIFVDVLPVGVTAAERTRRLAEIDLQLAAAEHRELDVIEDMERAGLPVTFRGDMSVDVLLRMPAAAVPLEGLNP